LQKFLLSITVAALVFAPCATRAQTTPISMYGVGPHGFDWAVGTWSCTSKSHVTRATLKVTRTSGGPIFYRSSGENFDNSWYAVYMPKTKTWVSPFIVDDGSYGTESTTQTGKKIVWTGTAYFADSGKTLQVRDTNVNGPNTYADLGEVRSAGTWKTEYSVSCTRA
jgi:hypothetical protein